MIRFIVGFVGALIILAVIIFGAYGAYSYFSKSARPQVVGLAVIEKIDNPVLTVCSAPPLQVETNATKAFEVAYLVDLMDYEVKDDLGKITPAEQQQAFKTILSAIPLGHHQPMYNQCQSPAGTIRYICLMSHNGTQKTTVDPYPSEYQLLDKDGKLIEDVVDGNNKGPWARILIKTGETADHQPTYSTVWGRQVVGPQK